MTGSFVYVALISQPQVSTAVVNSCQYTYDVDGFLKSATCVRVYRLTLQFKLMPYIPNSPEILLQRSDSKNPTHTCRGITVNGRHCKRHVGALRKDMTVSFCWQHKDQAERRQSGIQTGKRQGKDEHRTSIDSLAERLGPLHLGHCHAQTPNESKPIGAQAHRSGKKYHESSGKNSHSKKGKRKPVRQKSMMSWLCCIRATNDEELPRPKPVQSQRVVRMDQLPGNLSAKRARSGNATSQARSASVVPKSLLPRTSSQSQTYLSHMNLSLSPPVIASLLTEIAKPKAVSDAAGYIYMFWLTQSTDLIAKNLETTSLGDLDVFSTLEDEHRCNASKPVCTNACDRSAREQPLLLKIGRAVNVQRRMNQWQQQCGYSVSLIRWYPYVSKGNSKKANPMPDCSVPKMVPNAQRVERLIHLELAEQRVKKKCAVCKTEHREWFETDRSRSGIESVDRVIRRWVDWSVREM